MKLKIIHSIVFLFLLTVTPFLSIEAQNYNDAEMDYLMDFFWQSSNWQTAELNNPSSTTPQEKMDHLVGKGILRKPT